MTNQYMTDWAQAQYDLDSGHAASLAAGHEQAAALLRNLPATLIAAGGTQYLYATQGDDAGRAAAVDTWAAAHHVTARHRDGIGYCAELPCGAYSVMAVAISEKREGGDVAGSVAAIRSAAAEVSARIQAGAAA